MRHSKILKTLATLLASALIIMNPIPNILQLSAKASNDNEWSLVPVTDEGKQYYYVVCYDTKYAPCSLGAPFASVRAGGTGEGFYETKTINGHPAHGFPKMPPGTSATLSVVYSSTFGDGYGGTSYSSQVEKVFTIQGTWIAPKCATPSITVVGSGSTSSTPSVSWNAITGAGSYNVKVGSTTYTTTNTYYSLSQLSKGSYYDVSVQAVGTGDYTDSDWSQSKSVINMYKTPLSSPSVLASAASDSQINITIGAVGYATGYVLQYAANTSFAGATTVELGTERSTTITDLTANTTYYFRAQALTTATYYTNSSYSGRTACTTLKTPLEMPIIDQLLIIDCASVSAIFNKVENATGYIIEYSTDSSFANKQALTI